MPAQNGMRKTKPVFIYFKKIITFLVGAHKVSHGSGTLWGAYSKIAV
jgi:hypothetical protein